MKIAFEDHGEGFPIILIHAFPLSGKMWKAQAEHLLQSNYRVILPDMRGFGGTDSFSDINAVEDMAGDVSELMDTLKLPEAIIGGLSMGGYVALEMYRSFPDKIKALVLCDTNHAADTDEKREARFDLIEKIEKDGSRALIDTMLPKLVSERAKNGNTRLIEDLEKQFLETNPKAAIAALRGMAQRNDHTGTLSKINVPSLLVFGADDQVTPPSIGEFMRENISSAELVKIDAAGHYSNLEQPAAFNDALTAFLTALTL